jgi:prepilin-type N-terminal cleavage/methylation domain-containing protein
MYSILLTTKKARRFNKGFTLLESIIVFILIAITLSLSTMFFTNAIPSLRLNSTGRELSAMLRYAKMLAKNRGGPQTVLINIDTGRYGIEGIQTRNIPEGIRLRITDPLKGEINSGCYSIIFHESGIVDGGLVTIWNKRRTINIELDPVVGAVIL